jgi:hypothetical protein
MNHLAVGVRLWRGAAPRPRREGEQAKSKEGPAVAAQRKGGDKKGGNAKKGSAKKGAAKKGGSKKGAVKQGGSGQ